MDFQTDRHDRSGADRHRVAFLDPVADDATGEDAAGQLERAEALAHPPGAEQLVVDHLQVDEAGDQARIAIDEADFVIALVLRRFQHQHGAFVRIDDALELFRLRAALGNGDEGFAGVRNAVPADAEILVGFDLLGRFDANQLFLGGRCHLGQQRLGVVQDYQLETMAFGANLDMARDENRTALQMMLNDQQFGQQLQLNQQNFQFQTSLNYQSIVGGLLQQRMASYGVIGQSGASGEQMSAAARQMEDMVFADIDFLGSMFAAPGGPAAQVGAMGNPGQDYLYYGPPMSGDVENPGGP